MKRNGAVLLAGYALTGLILLILCLAALVGITLCWLIVLIQHRIKKARS